MRKLTMKSKLRPFTLVFLVVATFFILIKMKKINILIGGEGYTNHG